MRQMQNLRKEASQQVAAHDGLKRQIYIAGVLDNHFARRLMANVITEGAFTMVQQRACSSCHHPIPLVRRCSNIPNMLQGSQSEGATPVPHRC